MYAYTVTNIYYDKTTYTFDTYEELLAHYHEYVEPYTQGSDPYLAVRGIISRERCKV